MKVSKILFHISWLSVLYFLLLALNNYVIKSDFVLIGVVQELFTLPLMFAQLVVCVAAFSFWIKDKFKLKDYSFPAFIISLATSITLISTF